MTCMCSHAVSHTTRMHTVAPTPTPMCRHTHRHRTPEHGAQDSDSCCQNPRGGGAQHTSGSRRSPPHARCRRFLVKASHSVPATRGPCVAPHGHHGAAPRLLCHAVSVGAVWSRSQSSEVCTLPRATVSLPGSGVFGQETSLSPDPRRQPADHLRTHPVGTEMRDLKGPGPSLRRKCLLTGNRIPTDNGGLRFL